MGHHFQRHILIGILVEVNLEEATMSVQVSAASLGIDRLSVRERLELIEQIWDSLPDQVDPPDVPAWHLAQLARRRANAAAQPGVGRPWREVLGEPEAGS
jgi:putative addiction module component (TIGR02574 family)